MGEPTAMKEQFPIRKNVPIPLEEIKLVMKVKLEASKLIVRDASDISLSKGAMKYRIQIARYQRNERIL